LVAFGIDRLIGDTKLGLVLTSA